MFPMSLSPTIVDEALFFAEYLFNQYPAIVISVVVGFIVALILTAAYESDSGRMM